MARSRGPERNDDRSDWLDTLIVDQIRHVLLGGVGTVSQWITAPSAMTASAATALGRGTFLDELTLQ